MRGLTIGIPTAWRDEPTTSALLKRLVDEMTEQDALLVLDNTPEAGDRAGEMVLPGAMVIDASEWNLHQMWNFVVDTADDSETHAVLLNDDISIAPGEFLKTIEELCELAEENDIGVISPNYDGRVAERATLRAAASGRPYQVNDRADRIAFPRDTPGAGAWCGFAFALPYEVTTSYRFPEVLSWFYGDNHLGWWLKREGKKAAVAMGIHVTHAWHTTSRELVSEQKLMDTIAFQDLVGATHTETMLMEKELARARGENLERLQSLTAGGARVRFDGLSIVVYKLLDHLMPENTLRRVEFELEVERAIAEALDEAVDDVVVIDKPRGVATPQHIVWGKEA